jgi:hypothetical protein
MRIRPCIRNRGLTRSALSIIVALLVPGLAAPAIAKVRPPAKKDKEGCALDYAKGKERADAAALREAKELFSRCAKVSCGGFLQQECGHLYTQLGSDIPSVVPFVTDEAGMPRALVEVKMDGVLLTSRLDGHALQVDPGKREFSFETDDGVFATRKIMILQGQHNIPVKAVLPSGRRRASTTALATGDSSLRQAAFEVGTGKSRSAEDADTTKSATTSTTLETAAPQVADNDAEVDVSAAPARSRATPSRGIPALSYVFGGVGLVGVAGYFLLNTWGRKDNDELGSCSAAGQLCQPSDLDHIRKLYLAANISGGIGLAALATSAWLYVRSSSSTEETAPTRSVSLRGSQRISLRTVDVQASSAGALATVGGAF